MTPTGPADRRASLAERQADLVAAIVAGGPMPPGFDPVQVTMTVDALLRKRAAEVGARWPSLRAQFGPEWTVEFSRWARDRPPRGPFRDGWDYARHLNAADGLSGPARVDLVGAEARHRYDGVSPPRLRRLPTVRTAHGVTAVQLGGRVWTIRRSHNRRGAEF